MWNDKEYGVNVFFFKLTFIDPFILPSPYYGL